MAELQLLSCIAVAYETATIKEEDSIHQFLGIRPHGSVSTVFKSDLYKSNDRFLFCPEGAGLWWGVSRSAYFSLPLVECSKNSSLLEPSHLLSFLR